MNLTQLKYFKAVCTYHTASAAAEYLHISQPSLSSAIKELEREFGITLFRRHHRGMVLTPEGESLLKMSTDLLGRAEQIENVMNDLGKKRKALRLGVPPMIGSLVLPHIYGQFLKSNPDIEIEITEGGRQELMQKLDDDFLDMVFLPHNRPIDQTFCSQHVTKLEIVCCVSKESPVSSLKKVSTSDLKDKPLVLFKNSFFQTEEIKKWFSIDGIIPDILMQTEQLSTVQSVISNNIASGFMFRQLIDSDSGFVSVPLEKPMYADVSLVWKKDSYVFNSMKKFKEYMHNKNPFEKENN